MRISIFLFLVALTGCAAIVTPVPTGGSKADGIVKVSYTVSSMINATIDWTKADEQAKRRCQSWGYKGAERYEGGMASCNRRGTYGCTETRHEFEYQCTD